MGGTNWPLYVARRYLFTHGGKKGHLGNTLAIVGTTVGIMTLITVLTVMNGFQQGFIRSINEVYAYHLVVKGENLVKEALLVEGVKSAVGFYDIQGILSTDFGNNLGGQVRFLNITEAQEDRGFLENLIITRGRLPEKAGELVLGSELAKNLGVLPGDRIILSSFFSGTKAFQAIELSLVGVFETGYYEYNRSLGFGASERVSYEQYGLKLNNIYRDEGARRALQGLLPQGRVRSWREYNPAFFNALRFEKFFMFLVVGLIFIVVSVNIYHSMRRNVQERIQELALIKALGGGPKSLFWIYLYQGMGIAGIGVSLGTLLGVLLSWRVNEIIALFLSLRDLTYSLGGAVPGDFYFSDLPIEFLWSDLLWVNLVATLSVMVAALRSVRLAARVHPAEVFRSE